LVCHTQYTHAEILHILQQWMYTNQTKHSSLVIMRCFKLHSLFGDPFQ
jgi:hypothetical protein